MSESEESKLYIAYLVRLWKEKGTAGDQWRASIEDPSTGARQGFPTIEDLFSFLREQTVTPDKTSAEPGS